MSHLLGRIIWLAAVFAPAFAALGGGASHASRLPDDVDLYIELNGATRGEWRFVSSLAGPGVSLDASWADLSETVGLDEREAFERLLGTRVSIALRGVWEGEADWAALLTTDEETADLIRRNLKARPRRIVGGQTVLRLPGGRFELTTFREADGVTLMMAPAREGTGVLLDACAPPERALGETERAAAFEDLDEHGPHFISARIPKGHGWLSAGARLDERSASLRIAGRFERWENPRPVFAPEAWDGLFEGALLGVVERGRAFFEDGLFEEVPAMEPMARAMGPSAGDVMVALVRESAGGRELGGAVSVAGPESRAEKLDAGAAGSLILLAPAGDEGVYDFHGAYPRAMRTARLSETRSVSWRYLGDGWQPGWVVAGTSGELVDEIAATAASEAHRMRFRVTLDGEGGEGLPMAAWRSVGVVRPRALLSGGEGDAGVGGALAGLTGIETLRWRIRDLPSGRVDGELELVRAE